MSKENTKNFEVPMKEKLIFAAADIYGGGGAALIGAVYFCYLVAMGIGTVWAGSIIAIARIWDAVTDPVMGVIGDNTRTKWGRRRPYIFFGGMAIIASLAFLFLPLQGLSIKALKIVIYLLAYMCYNTLSTIINVSYSSLSTELATNPRETTQVNSLRLVFSMVASGAIMVGGTYLMDMFLNSQINVTALYLILVFGFGSVFTIPLILAGLFTNERVKIPKEKSALTIKTFVKPFSVKAFVYLLIAYLCAYVCSDLLSTNIVYFANYALDIGVGGAVLLAIILVCTGLTLPIYYKLMAKGLSKPFLFRVGIPVYILGIILLTMVPTSSKIVVIAFCIIVGLGMGGSQMLPWIIFPDVVDIAELKLGNRPTGSFSGIMTFTKKCSSAIAIFLSGLVLKLIGFNEPVADEVTGKIDYTQYAQTDGAILGIKLLIMVSVFVFMTLAFIYIRKLKLTTKRTYEIRNLIEKRNNGEEYTEEEKETYKMIEKELF
jgi:Na+/melibiose symporter-like transporter